MYSANKKQMTFDARDFIEKFMMFFENQTFYRYSVSIAEDTDVSEYDFP
jgi:hypothetical protein